MLMWWLTFTLGKKGNSDRWTQVLQTMNKKKQGAGR